MKICHLTAENFRTLVNFDTDVGKHNLFVGPNNTGKSNLLWAINCFYNPKRMTINDITKDSKGNPLANDLKITLTFDNLTDVEQKNNDRYFLYGKLKISLFGQIDEDQKFKVKYHGYIQAEKLKFPSNFDKELKLIVESEKVPNRPDVANFPELNEILSEIQPAGRIRKDNWLKSRIAYLNKHQEIERELVEELSTTEYQGFVKAGQHETTGECILIPAEKDPSEDLNTDRANTPVNQLVNYLVRDIESKEIKDSFQRFRKQLIQERNTKTRTLQDRFNRELKVWNTTVTINQRPFEISDTIPSNFEILFDDGVITDLERKGTGLQRYTFFKFLKISNELRLGHSTSLVLLFEEPEAHLHPQIQREIATILKQLSEDQDIVLQTFITTHSSQFIDILNLNEVFIFKKEDGYTDYSRCKISLNSIKEEIKTALFFNPHVNEIFFADRILLVEGQSEETSVNFFIQEGKLNVSHVSIISAKSKFNIPTFLTIFNAIKIPYCILIDEDPYFLPYYTNTNPAAIKERKKAYIKTREIADQIDETIGTLVVVSPDYDGFIGILNSQIKKHGKPLAIYNLLKKLKVSDPNRLNEIADFFNKLISPSFIHNVVNCDGSEWIFQNESDVGIPEADFMGLKGSIKQILSNYKSIVEEMTDEEREIVYNLFQEEI